MVRERRNWTAEEDALLKNAVELARSARSVDSQSLPWNTIALSVPGRTNKDCRKRFHYKVSSNVNRGAWTKTEDESLRAAVQRYGAKWSRVAVDVGTRNGDQCSKRWKNTIDPRIDRSAWSSLDEQLLTKLVELMGHNWKAIVNDHFPGRTALQARNQYNQIGRRTGFDTQQSTPGSIQSPATSSTIDRSLSRNSPARTRFKPQQLRKLPTATDLEVEELDENSSGVDDNDNDDDDASWSQSENCSQWNPANDASHRSAQQSLSYHCDMPPAGLDPLTNPLASDGTLSFSSIDYHFPDQFGFALGGAQALDPAFSQSDMAGQVLSHNLSACSPSQVDWTSSSNNLSTAIDSSSSEEIRRRVVIAARCSNTELGNLIQATTEALNLVSFSVTSQSPPSAIDSPKSLERGSRHIVITVFCLSEELGKLMQLVTDTCSIAVTITRLSHALTVDRIVYEVSESLFGGKLDILSLGFAGRKFPIGWWWMMESQLTVLLARAKQTLFLI